MRQDVYSHQHYIDEIDRLKRENARLNQLNNELAYRLARVEKMEPVPPVFSILGLTFGKPTSEDK